MVAASPRRRRKVAIIGGGMGGLAAALRLTETPEQRATTEVTVYQLGWRLGGKGASTRGHADRIEEHGLHMLMGHYETLFSLLRRVYRERDNDPDNPLATLEDAVSPWDHVVVSEPPESTGGDWDQWRFRFPRNSDLPGDGGPLPSPRAMLETLLGALDLLAGVEQEAGITDIRRRLGRGLRAMRNWSATPSGRRRLGITAELLGRVALGLYRDEVSTRGFEAIDHEDLRAWLRRHGASETLLASAGPRVMYDLLFARRHGDIDQQTLAAGVALRFALRMGFAYKGAVFWTMNAGMGEVVFAPIHAVLRQRGVHFAFFHRTDRLRLTPDHQQVDAIEMTAQASPTGSYEPLIDAQGVPAWPATPLYDQLDNSADLVGLDLEDPAVQPPHARSLTLHRGLDFDDVVLAVPPPAQRGMVDELCEHHPRWAAMMGSAESCVTIAVQLWLSRSLEDLGWHGSPPAMTSFIEPLNTYAELSHLLPREGWPDGVRSVAYLCAPGPEGCDRAWLVDTTRRWLEQAAPRLWPQACDAEGGFDWSLLVDPEDRAGPERLHAQYFTVNQRPSDRYVLSAPETMRHRIAPGESGLHNLFLAGDWTAGGMGCGCVEGAARSGVQAAHAWTTRREAAWHDASQS